MDMFPPALPAQPPDRSGADTDAQLIDLWLRGFTSPETRRAYAGDVKAFRDWAGPDVLLRAVTLSTLTYWRESLLAQGHRPAGVNRRLASIRSLLTLGQRTGYLHFNVGTALKPLPQADRQAERILSERDTLNLLHAAGNSRQGPRNQALLQYLYYTGSRVGEACALRWRDLHDLAGTMPHVTVHGKGGRSRHVALVPELGPVLQRLAPDPPDPDSPVFRTQPGRNLTARAVWDIVRAAARRSGLTAAVSPHWLRHAHASHALDRGAAVHVVQSTLGHASLNTTTHYVHVRPGVSSGHSLARLGADPPLDQE